MANTPFKLRSGNATPFKEMGASPVKQVNSNSWLTEYGKKVVNQKNVNRVYDAGITSDIGTWMKKKSNQYLPKNISGVINKVTKHIPKVVKNTGKLASKAFLPLAIAESLYSFGKTSVERKKAGLSGFNISESKSSNLSKSKKNQGFNF